jgi:hypothetical protein
MPHAHAQAYEIYIKCGATRRADLLLVWRDMHLLSQEHQDRYEGSEINVSHGSTARTVAIFIARGNLPNAYRKAGAFVNNGDERSALLSTASRKRRMHRLARYEEVNYLFLNSHWQEAVMRLQSDIDALAAIEEDAKAMLKRIGLPDDAHKLEVVVFLRQIVDFATYMDSVDRFIEAPINA